jgi:hypothetical protein
MAAVRFRAALAILGGALGLFAGQIVLPDIAPAPHDVRPGPGVTVRMLSDYLPTLGGTPGDTAVYILGSETRGGTVFVSGGTHANEIAGTMAALLLVERGRVEKGRLIVVPYANNSGITYRDPAQPGRPGTFKIRTAGGERTFPIGTRLTFPGHQGEPDPPGAREAAQDYQAEASPRDLDRQYPGKADGNLTQRIAAGIVALLAKESVDVAFDLHEAAPGNRLAMMIVAHPKAIELGAEAVLGLEADGLTMKLEESSATFRGLSHREWGDATRVRPFLIETPNPASRKESPGDPVSDSTWPLTKRVGIHLRVMTAILGAYNEGAGDAARVKIANLPTPDEIVKAGLGSFLR